MRGDAGVLRGRLEMVEHLGIFLHHNPQLMKIDTVVTRLLSVVDATDAYRLRDGANCGASKRHSQPHVVIHGIVEIRLEVGAGGFPDAARKKDLWLEEIVSGLPRT